MKQSKLNFSIASAVLLLPLALTSCGEGSNGGPLITESGKEDINAVLRIFEKGFRMDGVVTQAREIIDLANVGNAQKEEQTYKVVGLYENSNEREGTSITQIGKLGELDTIIDHIEAYADDKGYAYKECLDYKNEVQREYLKDYNNTLSFGASGLANFMGMLNANDFKYNQDSKAYDVNIDKIGIVLKNILGHVNSGFTYKPKSAVMTLQDGLFKNLDVQIEQFFITKPEGNTMIKTIYDNKVLFTFSEAGTTKLPRVTPYDGKPENAELKQALSKIGDNFTIDIENAVSIDDGLINKKYRMYKYDGEKILVQNYKENIEREMLTPLNHFLLKRLDGSQNELLFCHIMNAEEKYEKGPHRFFAKNYQGIYYYEDLLPTPSVISSDFFEYNPDFNEFICKDTGIVSRLVEKLAISVPPLEDEHVTNAYKIGIRLNDNGELDYIKFYISYKDLFNNSKIEGYVKSSFSDIGGTSI